MRRLDFAGASRYRSSRDRLNDDFSIGQFRISHPSSAMKFHATLERGNEFGYTIALE